MAWAIYTIPSATCAHACSQPYTWRVVGVLRPAHMPNAYISNTLDMGCTKVKSYLQPGQVCYDSCHPDLLNRVFLPSTLILHQRSVQVQHVHIHDYHSGISYHRWWCWNHDVGQQHTFIQTVILLFNTKWTILPEHCFQKFCCQCMSRSSGVMMQESCI